MNRPATGLLFILALLMAAPVLSCGSGDGDTNAAAPASAARTAPSQTDQAARLAAQTQLRSAQTAQESYFASHQTYAGTVEQLRGAGTPVSPKLKIISGDGKGYEMSVEINNEAHTTLSVKKTDTRTERTDSDGNTW